MNLNLDMNEIKELVINKFNELKNHTPKKGDQSAKEIKSKRKLKQMEIGAIMIVASAITGYFTYTYGYTPTSNSKTVVEAEANKVAEKRSILEADLARKVEIVKENETSRKKLGEYTMKYPNYRTRNEVLVVMNDLFSKIDIKLSNVSVSEVSMVTKSDVGSAIQNKGIAPLMKNAAFFPAAGSETPPTGTAPADEAGVIKDRSENPFDVTTVSLSLSGLTKAQVYNIVNVIDTYERAISMKSTRVTESGGNFSIAGDILFYAYRNNDLENLF